MNTPLMQDEMLADAVRELGLADVSQEFQEAAIATLGDNIHSRLLFEIFAVLPKAKHAEFAELMQSANASPARLHTYLEPYISDFPAFVQRIAADEVAQTKALLAKS
jgi:hypothetical protein